MLRNLVFLWICIACTAAPAQAPSFHAPLRLDGFTVEYVNMLNLFERADRSPLLTGDPFERFPEWMPTPLFDYVPRQSNALAAVSGQLAAETGEAMLNRPENPEWPNRDHETGLHAYYTPRHIPLRLFAGYRYLDSYSDRFDSLWGDYRRAGNAMRHDERGLANETGCGLDYAGRKAAIRVRALDYERWGRTPFFHSPLYTEGYLGSARIDAYAGSVTLFGELELDQHEDYQNHTTPEQYHDYRMTFGVRGPVRNQIRGSFSISQNSRLRPHGAAYARLEDTASTFLAWRLSAHALFDGRAGGSAWLSMQSLKHFRPSLWASWASIPQYRDLSFFEGKIPVRYTEAKQEVTELELSLAYRDTLIFPLTALIQYAHHSAPSWERITRGDNTVTIARDSLTDAADMSLAAAARYELSWSVLRATLWGAGSAPLPLDALTAVSPGVRAGIDIGCGSLEDRRLYGGVRIAFAGKSAVRYWDQDSANYIIYGAPAYTAASLIAKLPFFLPWFRTHSAPAVWIEAGPFRFSREQRMRQHPRGNYIGPAIAVRFTSAVY